MPVYAVSYDLTKDRNYKKLHDAIKQNPHCQILESFWLVKHEGKAIDLCRQLKSATDNDDKLFVIETRVDWASDNLMNRSDCLRSTLNLSC